MKRFFQFLFFMSLLSFARPVMAKAIFVISHPELNLSKDEIKDVYLGRKKFGDGQKIKAVSNKMVLNEFLRKVVSLRKISYLILWEKKAFREGMIPPKSKNNDQEVLNFVRQNKGGIGFVSEKPDSSVKVIAEF